MTTHNRGGLLLAAILLVAGLLPLSTLVNQLEGYLAVMTVYLLIGPFFVRREGRIRTFASPLLLISLPIVAFISHLFTTYSESSLLRLLPFTVVPLCNIYVVPRLTTKRNFLWLLGRVAAVVASLGLAVFILGDVTLLGTWVTPYPAGGYEPFWSDQTLHPVRSIFRNPNPFSIFLAAGATATIPEMYRRRTAPSIAVFGLCASGIYLSNSRGGQVGFLAGGAIVALYLVLPLRKFYYATVLAIGGFSIGSLAILGVVPIPIHISLTGREIIWSGALEAAQRHLLFGYGLVDLTTVIEPYISSPRYSGLPTHNSYIQILLSGGVVALFGYVGFILWCLVKPITEAADIYTVGLLGVAFGLTVNQMFETFSLFGISGLSIVTSTVYGYLIQELTTDCPREGGCKTGNRNFQNVRHNNTDSTTPIEQRDSDVMLRRR